jgi:hypothetical protein
MSATILTITFVSSDPAEPGTEATKTVELHATSGPPNPELLLEYLVSEARKELSVNANWQKLPDFSDLVPTEVRHSFRLEDFFSGRYFNRMNTSWLWLEIGRTLLRTKALLAEAKSYRDLEKGHKGPVTENRALYSIHRRKLRAFDLAVYGLCKVEDLMLRLLFEALGASIPAGVDMSSPGWERSLTWENFKRSLKERRGELQDQEYKELRRLLAKFRSHSYERRLVGYRDRLTHRPTPSVDYPELSAPMEDRVGVRISDPEHRRFGTQWTVRNPIPSKPDYTFDELYKWAVGTLSHHVELLRHLKDMPRFT